MVFCTRTYDQAEARRQPKPKRLPPPPASYIVPAIIPTVFVEGLEDFDDEPAEQQHDERREPYTDPFGILRRSMGSLTLQSMAWMILTQAHKAHEEASGIPCTPLVHRSRLLAQYAAHKAARTDSSELPTLTRCQLPTCPSCWFAARSQLYSVLACLPERGPTYWVGVTSTTWTGQPTGLADERLVTDNSKSTSMIGRLKAVEIGPTPTDDRGRWDGRYTTLTRSVAIQATRTPKRRERDDAVRVRVPRYDEAPVGHHYDHPLFQETFTDGTSIEWHQFDSRDPMIAFLIEVPCDITYDTNPCLDLPPARMPDLERYSDERKVDYTAEDYTEAIRGYVTSREAGKKSRWTLSIKKLAELCSKKGWTMSPTRLSTDAVDANADADSDAA